MKEIFDAYVETSFDGVEQAQPKFKQFEYNYKKILPTQGKILDIGIGRGEMLSCLKNWAYDGHGIDISPSTIAYCQKKGLSCELIVDTVAWLNEHPGMFAAITLLDVIEHIPKKEIIIFLAALKKALIPGGVLIMQTPNLQAPDGFIHRFNDFTHEVGFTENSLRQVLLTAGFTDFYVKGFEILVSKKSAVVLCARIVRWCYWKCVTIRRMLNTNLHPAILNPVFFAVVKKT